MIAQVDGVSDALFPSKARRLLLLELFREGTAGASVSELARRARLTPRAVSLEVQRLDAAGLVRVEAVGSAHVVTPREEHPAAGPLRALLRAAPASAEASEREVRASLAAYGAPLPCKASARPLALAETLLRGLDLGRRDATVLLVLPNVLARNALGVDWGRLRERARHLKLKAELGLLIELTADLAGMPSLASQAAGLRDGRRRVPRHIDGGRGPNERRLAELRSPGAALRWNFRMNMTEEAFRSAIAARRIDRPDSLRTLLQAIDAELTAPVEVALLGSSALDARYRSSHATSELEMALAVGPEARRGVERASANLGASTSLIPAADVRGPAAWQSRLVPVDSADLRFLRPFTPERHDLALMRCLRATTHDLQAVEDIHAADPLRLGVLLARYYETDEPALNAEVTRMGFLALVERLFGPEAAARTERGLLAESGGP